MESPDPSQRGVYFPMELLPREILQRLGNVRVLVVPKERSSSSKENEEESFGKKEDRNLYDGPPLSPSVNYRQMGQSFDFRLTSPEGERYPMKERQEVEVRSIIVIIIIIVVVVVVIAVVVVIIIIVIIVITITVIVIVIIIIIINVYVCIDV